MELKRFKIQLDIKRKIYNEVFQVVQGDYDSNVIEIELLNDDEKYDLTGLNVEIAFRKADGTTVVQTINSGVTVVSAINGKIECILRTNTIAAIGRVTAEVRVLGTDNKLLTSTTFDFIVREAIVSDDTIESTNEFPVLLEMIDTVNTLIDEVSQIEQQVPENILQNIGDLTTLITDDKSSLVNAINEVNSDLTNVETNVNQISADLVNIEGYIGYTDNDIYGVEVDVKNNKFTRLAGAVGKNAGIDFDNVRAFGGRRRCIVTDSGVVLAYYGDSAYTETGALAQEVIKNGTTYPAGTHVQVMVEQPKFYYRVVPLELERIEYKEINTLTVTAGATASGNVTVNLDGKSYNIAVTSGDDINTVATKIRGATYTGWTTGGTGAKVTFTCNTPGTKTTATFNGGSTGVTATVEKTVAGSISIGYHMRKARYYVSDTYKPGFKVHPAFIRNGVVKDKIYLSAYEGSIYDVSAATYLLADEQVADFTVSTGDKLSSIAYAKPASGLIQNLTRANTRKLANNRGVGWQLSDVLSASVTQMLFIIEYASFNIQDKIGLGIVNKTDDSSTNMSELTGATTNLGNASGMAAGTNGLTSVSYRGEENPWGNIWKWMDGLNIEAKGIHQAYWADSDFADDIKTSPYKNCGFTLAKANGYVSAFGYSEDCDFLFLPSEVIGASNLPVGDYFYQNHNYNGFFVARLGGGWNHGSYAGTFGWVAYTASFFRSRTIGGRLLYVPQ